jgi:hypothetical protein
MTRTTRLRLFSLLVLLGVLAGVFTTPAVQTATAAPPCDYCEAKFESCLARTCCTQCNGNDTCCRNLVASCWASCI